MQIKGIEQQTLDTFLASVEKRAFRMAEFAVANREEALDLVKQYD